MEISEEKNNNKTPFEKDESNFFLCDKVYKKKCFKVG